MFLYYAHGGLRGIEGCRNEDSPIRDDNCSAYNCAVVRNKFVA